MTKQKQMTEKELDQVSGGPHYKDFNGARLFVTYTEVEIHKPSAAGSETHFNKRPVNSDDPVKRPWWRITR